MQKEVEVKLKFKSLYIAIQQMWNLKYKIIPVIIGATGIVRKGLRKNLGVIPGKHSVDSLHKTTIIETSHITWKYSSMKLEACDNTAATTTSTTYCYDYHHHHPWFYLHAGYLQLQ
jgi:hypothetical protein